MCELSSHYILFLVIISGIHSHKGSLTLTLILDPANFQMGTRSSYLFYFLYLFRSSWNTRFLLNTSLYSVTIIASTTHISDVTQLPFVKLKANSCHGILRTSFTLYYNGYCSEGRCCYNRAYIFVPVKVVHIKQPSM